MCAGTYVRRQKETFSNAPSRRTFAWGAVIRINAATNLSALNSW